MNTICGGTSSVASAREPGASAPSGRFGRFLVGRLAAQSRAHRPARSRIRFMAGLVLGARRRRRGLLQLADLDQSLADQMSGRRSATRPHSVGAGGGTTAVSVTAQPECAWTVAENVSWIAEVVPVSGQGNGQVEIRVTANADPAARKAPFRSTAPMYASRRRRRPASSTSHPAREPLPAAAARPRSPSRPAADAVGPPPATIVGHRLVGRHRHRQRDRQPQRRCQQRKRSCRHGHRRRTDRHHHPGCRKQPPSCTYTVAPLALSVAAAGGSESVAVTAGSGCSWTAASSVSWVTVTTGASGSANGTVTLTIAANTGAARTATVTIAGQVVTITQAAAGP